MAETEQAAPKGGSRLTGVLGAFLGALLGALLTDALILLIPGEFGRLTILANMILVGWFSCKGYQLFRGCRSLRFAQWAVRGAIILAQPLALTVTLTASVAAMAWGTLPLTFDSLLFAFSRSAAYLLSRDARMAWLLLILGTLLFVRLSWTGLLKYVDPAWYSDPRRLARVGGGGATFNVPPCWPLPPADVLPASFEVDKGKLTVEGSALTFKPWAKPRRTFPVSQIAGVVLGVSTGFNILYNKENRELARFAWSRQNALLFGQYLIAHNIPFIDPNGDPIPAQGFPEPQAPPPDAFTLRQPRLAAIVGWACLLFFGAAAILTFRLLDFPASLLCGGVFLFFVLLSLYLLLSRKNQRLEVADRQLTYTSLWGKTTAIPLRDIDRGVLTTGRLKLLDREGRPLLKLGLDMENISLLTQYLQAHQVPLGPSKPRKD